MALVNEASPRRPREPAWHRRVRRERSGFRILARVAAACVSLERHHGSHPPEILRPLLFAVRHPLPSEVPWPRFSEKGALRKRKPESSEVAQVPPPISSSTISSTLVSVTSVGDFLCLPCEHWRSLRQALYNTSRCRVLLASTWADTFRGTIVSQQVRTRAMWRSFPYSSEPQSMNVLVATCFDKCFDLFKSTLLELPSVTFLVIWDFLDKYVVKYGILWRALQDAIAISELA
jgi:hypothetical protein